MTQAWLLLLAAGVFEIGWPLGLKKAASGSFLMWAGFAALCMLLSGFLLYQAQKTIPIGTAYAVWTGIGAAGTFVIGLWLFGDSMNVMRLLSVTLIIAGVIGLKMAH